MTDNLQTEVVDKEVPVLAVNTGVGEAPVAVFEVPRGNSGVSVPNSPAKTTASWSSATRRKPVPPPKDETTLPSWITQVKKPKRRPVSVASYTLTLSDQSVGEGPSTTIPTSTPPQNARPQPETQEFPPLTELPIPEKPPFIPELATTKSSIPMRRINSLPPYGPGPTTMYVLPTGLSPATTAARSLRRKPSRKRWRPSPGSVRRTVVVIKKLQDITDASLRPPPLPEKGLEWGQGLGSVRRVATRPFMRTGTGKGKEVAEVNKATEGEENTMEVEVEGQGEREGINELGGWTKSGFGRTFGSVKRVAYQSFRRKPTTEEPIEETTVPTVDEETVPELLLPPSTAVDDDTITPAPQISEPEPPKPPATYAQYLSRASTEQLRSASSNKRKFPTIPNQYKQFLKRTKTEASLSMETPRKRKMTVTMPQYKALLKRMKTEPSNRSVGDTDGTRGRGFNAGQWIDEHFDFFPPPKRRVSRKPVPGTTQPVSMIDTPQATDPEITTALEIPAPETSSSRPVPRYRTFITRKETWLTVPRTVPTIKLPNLRVKHRTTKVSKSLIRGWDRIIISTSTLIPKRTPAQDDGVKRFSRGTKDVRVGSGVRAVTPAEERMSLGSGEGDGAGEGGSVGSRSETFHTDGEIIEAEEVIEVARVHEIRVPSPVMVERRAVSPVRMEVGESGREGVEKGEGVGTVNGPVEGEVEERLQGVMGTELKVE